MPIAAIVVLLLILPCIVSAVAATLSRFIVDIDDQIMGG